MRDPRLAVPILSSRAALLGALLAGCSSSTPASPPDLRAGDFLAERAPDARRADADARPKADGPPPGRCQGWSAHRNPYFGDLHVHTSYSFDAYVFETRNTPRDAYRFARGEAVGLPPLDGNGKPTRTLQLDRPLDFAGVTDHSEYLGEVEICTVPGKTGYDSPTCQLYRSSPNLAFADFGAKLALASPSRFPFCGVGGAACAGEAKAIWKRVQDAAKEAQDSSTACTFTSFVAYEWTGTTGGANLHRNVVFRNDKTPDQPTSYFEQPTADGLRQQLKATCLDAATGCDVLAIPHNSNLSKGKMFAPQNDDGTPLNAAQAAARAVLEPLVEIYQHKGDSECQPGPLGSDELCEFEKLSSTPVEALSFVREALKEGLAQQAKLGVNPFKLGLIGSTDTHNGTPGATVEQDFGGHGGSKDATLAARLSLVLTFGPGGLAVAWAEENSREAIFAALHRRETYATSGTRPIVRFFGGWSYPADLCGKPDLVDSGYKGGVPMGGDLGPRGSAKAPVFAISALRDAGSAGRPGTQLQRLQVIKGWLDAAGAKQEKVYEVAGDPKNGASVDTSTCTTSGKGFDSLCAVWTDPDFDPARPAFYYARAVENPSCRWTAWNCVKAKVDCQSPPPLLKACCDPATPKTVSERAWTSPIWYKP